MISRGLSTLVWLSAALSLCACGGGGGGPGTGSGITPNMLGWGLDLTTDAQGKNPQATLFAGEGVRIDTNDQDEITQVVIDNGGKSQSFTCTGTLSKDTCVTAAGYEINVDALPDYSYLKALSWAGASSNASSTPRLKMLVGGKPADRTAEMPKRGTATYKGTWGGYLSPDKASESLDVSGDVTLKADFRTGTVSGRFENFKKEVDYQIDEVPIPGSFTLQNGKITGNTLKADLSGTIDRHVVDAARSHMNGAFFGPKAEEVGGGFVGHTTDSGKFGGLWIAKKK